MENKAVDDGYSLLDDKGKDLVEMYITARQFKNAILDEEMIVLPLRFNDKTAETIVDFEVAKITFRGNKILVRIYPFIVNKSFACEVYLKLLLVDIDFDFKRLKRNERHNILKLYKNTSERFKQDFLNVFITSYGGDVNKEFLEKQISNIADAFERWRYIYEKINQENEVNNGFLSAFCEFLDRYCQQLILAKYKYNVDKNMR